MPKSEQKGKKQGAGKEKSSNAACRTESISSVIGWIGNNATLDDLTRIDVAVRRTRKSLVEKIPKEQIKPRESYHQKIKHGHLYWYKNYVKDGKMHSEFVGKELPDDLDRSMVSISEKADSIGRRKQKLQK